MSKLLDSSMEHGLSAARQPDAIELQKNRANYVPLSPIGFLKRAAHAHGSRIAIVYDDVRLTYKQFYERARRLASALTSFGLAGGDVVATLLPNVPAMVECHFGVPMGGFVLNTLNTRLDPASIAFMLSHSASKVLLVDPEFSSVAREALAGMANPPTVVFVRDEAVSGTDLHYEHEYEHLLLRGDPEFEPILVVDEWQSLSINYTSGTTGDPKGVVYSHRGAYLSAIGNLVTWTMPHFPVYLWSLPLFHCNGWCFPWAVTAVAGTHVCIRRLEVQQVQELISKELVTHLCGAPIILNLLLNVDSSRSADRPQKIFVMTGGAPIPATMIEQMEARGFEIIQVYGLTEVYGGIVYSGWDPSWNVDSARERANLKARQGIRYCVQEDLMVADLETLHPVPPDGSTMGEVFLRGNVTMKGYFKNPVSTEKAFSGGWLHTGDLGVMHPDGYVELKDRSKDIIISGGENISSIEVETALYAHPAVLEAAVVARPDVKWGESPCAFVTLKTNANATAEELVAFLRTRIAGYKLPKQIIFGELPKTVTGKIQKNVLRVRARSDVTQHGSL